jgi:hypothetical protein
MEAAGLIGKTVEIATGEDQSTSGVVTGVSLVKGQAMLWLGSKSYPLGDLITVSGSPEEDGTPAAAGSEALP